MADLFDSVRVAVTARQAAERYGLEFDPRGAAGALHLAQPRPASKFELQGQLWPVFCLQ